jgi:hypothetical protein
VRRIPSNAKPDEILAAAKDAFARVQNVNVGELKPAAAGPSPAGTKPRKEAKVRTTDGRHDVTIKRRRGIPLYRRHDASQEYLPELNENRDLEKELRVLEDVAKGAGCRRRRTI